MTAKTKAELMSAMREKRRGQGMTQQTVWVHGEQLEAFKKALPRFQKPPRVKPN